MDFGYSYDRLNRLTGCAVADAVYTYAMDEFGNITARTWAAGGGGDLPSSLALVVNRATNRLGGAGYGYDVLGNLVTMPAPDSPDSLFMTYLDQGHIGTLTDAAGVVWKYYYDADGKRRVKVKTAGGAATEPDGQGGVRLVADRSYYFYEGENLICQQDIGTLVQDESQYEPKFLLLDHLGSTRAELVFTESGGVFSPVIQEYYDLMPYGEVIDPPSVQESVLFTGKSRDTESGLDYFGPRGFNPNLCRWLSPDQPFADSMTDNPQSWNLYAYCRGNPIVRIDITGFDIVELTKIVRQISSDLNQAYSSSFRLYQRRNGEIVQDSVEVGGNVVRTQTGNYDTRDVHDDNKRTEVSIRPDRIEIGDTLVGHFHTHRVEPGSTFSEHDVRTADKAGKYSILESGTKRYAIEITDTKAFTSFIKKNQGAIQDAMQKAQVKSKADEVKVIASFASQKGSGFKLYQTVDAKKVKWEEVKQ